MKKRTDQNADAPDAEVETLAQTLEGVAGLLRSGACHLSGDKLSSILAATMAQISHDGPSGLLTSYQVCERLNGVTSRTLYNWVDAGLVPKPFQLPGAGNTNFWYSDEIDRVRKDLIKKNVL